MLIGQFVGPFEVVSEIGSGAMGTVYRARWHRDGKVSPVALKVIALGLASNDGAMARFEREANILKQLRHPHIVRLYATGRHKQTPFIAMEFVNGEGLDRILGRRGKMSWEDVVGYAKQLCEALQHAHEKGIIHRDLKPSNLMVTPDGKLKLTDFGIAKDTDVTALTGANSTIGTAAYMSPEQCRGDRNLSAKSDLYSLGIVLYELLTGRKPFTADTTVEMFLKHVNEKPIRPSKLVPDLPVWLDNLIMFLLEKEREHRPLDAGTVRKLLGEIEEKVSTQQSVGAEVANARRADRPIRERKLDESEKDIARSLRSPGKKRKKKRTDGGRVPVWLKAGIIAAALAGVVGVIAYLSWPEGMDAAYGRVQAAAPGEERVAAAAKFLDRFGGDTDPRVAEVRDLYKADRVRAEEETLARRHSREHMRNNPEGYDEEAYQSAMNAMDAEGKGQIGPAANQWANARDKSPAVEPGTVTAADSKVVLGWVAAKRHLDNQQGVRNLIVRLREQIKNDQLFELPRPNDDPNNPEQLANHGLRLMKYPDHLKARSVLESLAKLTEKDFDKRDFYLLATSITKELKTPPKEGNEVEERRALLEKQVSVLDKKADSVRNDTENKVERRKFRNDCREIIELYASEQSEMIQPLVERARKLLESVPK
ncbi:MAG TPA: serine/threonine-protein kinase [Fimbriiglobus sp.]|jgi:serine/threonine-protein kinase|nr:serine/threonine-protein kinase [Fimbriiglobus sp.]